MMEPMLVGGLEHLLFSRILEISIPTDYYFSEGLKTPTSMDFTPITPGISGKQHDLKNRPGGFRMTPPFQ